MSIMASLDVLNLLAHLVDHRLEIEANRGERPVDRLRAERVGLAVELLAEKIETTSHRRRIGDEAERLLMVRPETVQFLPDIGAGGKERDLLGQPLRRKGRLAGDQQRELRLQPHLDRGRLSGRQRRRLLAQRVDPGEVLAQDCRQAAPSVRRC